MQIIFGIPYQKYTQIEEVTLKADTIREAMGELFNRFPQLFIAVLDGELTRRTALIVDDEEFLTSELVDMHASTVEFIDVPAGEDFVAIGVWIGEAAAYFGAAGGTIEAIGVAIANSAVLAGIVGGIVVIGAQIALQFIMGALSGDMSAPDLSTQSLNNSATYTWSGIKNTTASGTAIPIVYGLHRTGGMILSLYTKSLDSDTSKNIDGASIVSQTDLYYQLGLCEGPIENVSAIEINKLPFSFYNSVEFASMIRTGEETQSPISQFSEIDEVVTIARKVTNTNVPLAYDSISRTLGDYLVVSGLVDNSNTRGSSSSLLLGPYTQQTVADPPPDYGGG